MKAMLFMVVLNTGVLNCEVMYVGVYSATVVCEDDTLLRIPLTEWRTFVAWPHVPREGLILKAARDAEGLHSVADCETRTREMVEAYCGDMYCRPPSNLMPDDCLLRGD